jgi:hypothetical protein
VLICIGYLTWLQVNWSAVWRIRAPPKVKHVGCILTRVRLLQRLVDCSHLCLQCTAEPEYDLHSFFTCPAILDSWATAALGAAVYNRLQCGLYSRFSVGYVQ